MDKVEVILESILFRITLGEYKENYDTATKTANKLMGFDLSAIQSCLLFLIGPYFVNAYTDWLTIKS